MGSNPRSHRVATHDVLSLLTAKNTEKYPKGQLIYSESQPPKHLHLVISGRVKVVHRARERRPVLIGLYGPEEFFGECVLLDLGYAAEEATALDDTKVMRWTSSEVEDLISSRPQLGVALLQVVARRAIDFSARLADTLAEKTGERTLHSLVRFSERLGSPPVAGSIRIAGMSHQLLAQYAGTSREIVSQHMNRFRRQGLLEYSRREIVLNEAAFEVAAGAERGRHSPDFTCPLST
jgi:CRP/FNR family transcriptional regulator, cyclic AMP receptor protein